MGRRRLDLSRVYRLLEPGPVVLLTTAHRGRVNVMTLSWHTMMEFEPPLMGCVVSGRNFSFDLLRKAKACVIAIPTASIARKVVEAGNCSGESVDKFATLALTPVAASQVPAPLVAECFANLECRVADTRLVNRYNFFVLEVVAAWIDPDVKAPKTIHHRGYGEFFVAGRTLKLPSRMK
jgi:flavin reductase (DIM6/NTAB) family NADH-FMN oxidoreductase RutF